MIHTSLSFITNELNEYLKVRTGTPDVNRVFLTSVATETGVVIPEKSLGVSLINIEEERVYKDQRSSIINSKGKVEYVNPELKLNLYVLISANFQDTSADNDTSDDYVEGLKQLSFIISFFQAKNVFTPDNSPNLAKYDPKIKNLVVELYSYTFEQLYNFWSVVGAKYLPSVLYKVRMVTFQEGEFFDSGVPIEKINIDSKTKL